MKTWLICASVFVAGCSSSLPFNFQFASTTDAGSGKDHDLAMVVDDLGSNADLALADLSGAPLDQAVGAPHDLISSHDLANTPTDLVAAKDLLVVVVGTTIGAPCTTCTLNMTCFTSVPLGSDASLTLPNGYCSKACKTGLGNATECLGLGGECVAIANPSNSDGLCLLPCGEACAARYTEGYGCCSRSIASSVSQESACLTNTLTADSFTCSMSPNQ